MYKAVLFDLDGTLCNTIDDITKAVNYMLSACNYPLRTHDDILGAISFGRREFLRRLLPAQVGEDEERLSHALVLYTSYYKDHYMDTTHPYPGMVELIEYLKSCGILTAVVTNKVHHNAVYMVETLFPQNAFDGIWGLSEFPPKPDPTIALHAAESLGVSPDECLFVGDSELDMLTAHNAGMHAVGVAWGYRPTSVLLESGASHIVNTAAELKELALNVDLKTAV